MSLFVNELQKVIPIDEEKMQEDNCDQKEEIHGFFPAKKKAKTQESALEMVERYIRTETPESNELLILNSFPYINKVFRKFNTTLPSSASVERLFSHAGIIFQPKRRLLTDKNFEHQLMLKLNKKYYTQ